MTRRNAPDPGAGGALDGGQPWDNVFDDYLSGVRFVQLGRDPTVHVQAYAIDPARPEDDPGRLVLAETTVCGLSGRYLAPTRALPACQACRDGVPRALEACRLALAAP